jgi:hypothetical protein
MIDLLLTTKLLMRLGICYLDPCTVNVDSILLEHEYQLAK